MEYWVLYLCSIADSVHTLLMVLSIVGLIVSVILFFMSVCSSQCDVRGTRTCVAKGVKKSGVKEETLRNTYCYCSSVVCTYSFNKPMLCHLWRRCNFTLCKS